MTSSSISKSETRKFGAIALTFFGCLFALALWRNRENMQVFFAVLGGLGLLLALFPVRLRIIHKGWMALGMTIGKVLNTIMMSIAFYAVITPAGLLARLFRAKLIKLRPDRKVSTYWVKREVPAQPRKSFKDRF